MICEMLHSDALQVFERCVEAKRHGCSSQAGQLFPVLGRWCDLVNGWVAGWVQGFGQFDRDGICGQFL